ncbi:UbiA family prenyltransferase [Candidatus Thiodictyon syntrophicum]|uniref:Prenyltransferase n=1 Tax=Candidatus Thiodictyon syntrophicum TaxID=1166950 RepID=A0A2K8U9A7_9GAMM|nr:UbiA family prenyltransferase [Candidatus Thiodictyon syntrophicum]AUB82127.1 hypothetical protein THSYN_14990 [Candidatus Thiodictyon syntrophicum]
MRSASCVRDYLQLVRLPATFSAWSNIIAAHLIATGAQPQWRVLWLQLAASTALYWSGMILNDCFDLALDRRERPHRPLPAGRIPVRRAWVLGGGLMVAGLGLAARIGAPAFLVALALALAILAYDGLLKGGGLGPLTMGTCRALNWLLGLSVVPMAAGSAALVLPVLLYTMAVTVLSGSEARGADARTNGITAALLGLVALSFIALVGAGRLGEPLVLAALALAVVPLAGRLRRMAEDGSPAAVQRMMRFLLLGMIPLDALLLLGSGHWPLAAALLLLLVPGRLLARRLYVT